MVLNARRRRCPKEEAPSTEHRARSTERGSSSSASRSPLVDSVQSVVCSRSGGARLRAHRLCQ